MASFTFTSDRFPNGTTVSVYTDTRSPKRLNGTPPGALVTSGTVSGGSVTFTGLSADTRYIAYAASPDRYANFSTFDNVPPAQQVSGVSGSGYLGEYSSLAANTPVKAGQLVSNAGVLYARIADGTISGAFTASNWTAVSGTPLDSSVKKRSLSLFRQPGMGDVLVFDNVGTLYAAPIVKAPAAELVEPLAASGVYTGRRIDLGTMGGTVVATLRGDQAATLTIDDSTDGVTWTQIASAAAAQVGTGPYVSRLAAATLRRYARGTVTNTATAMTTTELAVEALS